ncbi:MAG TPA: hypothetical protein VK590_05235 [Saprospiraceae bacterium]|nr:hypothetical protein [Saprospiraceae bacterium]
MVYIFEFEYHYKRGGGILQTLYTFIMKELHINNGLIFAVSLNRESNNCINSIDIYSIKDTVRTIQIESSEISLNFKSYCSNNKFAIL